MVSDTLWRVFRAFSNLHWKLSDHGACNIAGLFQTSENVCIPDASTNSMLVLLLVAIVRLGCQNMS